MMQEARDFGEVKIDRHQTPQIQQQARGNSGSWRSFSKAKKTPIIAEVENETGESTNNKQFDFSSERI